jgi:hypothetical protein
MISKHFVNEEFSIKDDLKLPILNKEINEIKINYLIQNSLII